MWARQHKIDLNELKGTGKKGRILKDDIIYFLENRYSESNVQKIGSETTIKAKILPESKMEPIYEIERVKMNDLEILQQGLATYSTTIPHLYLQQLFDVTVLMPIM